jgi:hypothetical protein
MKDRGQGSTKSVLIRNKGDFDERELSMEEGFEMREKIGAIGFVKGSARTWFGIEILRGSKHQTHSNPVASLRGYRSQDQAERAMTRPPLYLAG